MIVRFATICDIINCKTRSDEYTAYPSCTICSNNFCPQHGKVTIEADLNCPERGICINCKDIED
jgi:hypothetical protein